MARPSWSGQIQISLVSFGVRFFPAVESKSEIRFHQINRKSGERVHHQKVSAGDDEPVEKDDIVKGYEYSKGEYVQIEPEEIANLRIPSKHTLEVQQFVSLSELSPSFFEKPYFVAPESDSQAEAFAVVRQALAETKKAALGKVTLSGREHLMAITAPPDPDSPGLMAYELRYAEELRQPAEYFSGIRKTAINDDSLSLAKELIQRKSGKFDPSRFKDGYEAALRELVEAKLKNLPIPKDEKPAPASKVVNLMDALRRSVEPAEKKAAAPAASGKKSTTTRPKVTEMPKRTRSADKRRKSA